MPKLNDAAITQSDLAEYLDQYSDFSFELEVLKMLREYDINCDHGGCYVDPVTGKTREFDIGATKTINQYRFRMAIECKNIRENFPILVSCVPRHKDESYHQIVLARDPRVSSLFSSRATIFDVRDEHTLYSIGDQSCQIRARLPVIRPEIHTFCFRLITISRRV